MAKENSFPANGTKLAWTVFFLMAATAIILPSISNEAAADDFHVNSTDDLPDLNPGDGVCSTGRMVGDEPERTLRAAVMEANAHPGRDNVMIPAGVYYLTLRDEDFDEGMGRPSLDYRDVAEYCKANDLDITGQTRLVGAGPGRTIIDGLFLLNHRVLHVLGSSSVENLTIRNGVTHGDGGGVYVERADLMNIENVHIEMCVAEMGGGISIQSGGPWDINLKRCQIKNNRANANGGGVHIASPGHYRIIFDEVWIDQNHARSPVTSRWGKGGGVYLDMGNRSFSSRYQNITIVNKSTISRNTAGGIFNRSSNLILLNSTVCENKGGGIHNEWDHTKPNQPTVLQTRFCTVVNNTQGYGIFNDGRIPFQIGHSIVARNLRISPLYPYRHLPGNFISTPDLGRVNSLGHNLFGPNGLMPDDTPTAYPAIAESSDLTLENPGLHPSLGYVGGFAPSYRLRYDSPAINGGTTDVPSIVGSLAHYLHTTSLASTRLEDQRGIVRPMFAAADIGALEYAGPTTYDWDKLINNRDVLKPQKYAPLHEFRFELKEGIDWESEGDEAEEEAIEKEGDEKEKPAP